jgi:parallel beta-helix repeat protein
MNKKVAASWVSLAVVLSFIMIIVEIAQVVEAPTTWYVDDVPGDGGPGDPPEDFTSIQDAINASIDGDKVFVYNGTYYEHVFIDKTINLTGEDKDMTIIEGDGSGNVIIVTVDWVNVSGFTIMNGGDRGWPFYDAGIKLNNVYNCTISNNIVASNNYHGISLNGSSNNNIMSNMISDSRWNGIDIYSLSSNNIISGNNISDTGGICIHVMSNGNTIIGNNISKNLWGVYIYMSSNNNIIANSFVDDGIFIYGHQLSHFNSHNIPTNNTVNGIPLYYYKDCSLIDINGISIGQLILANCMDIEISNLTLNYTDVGIEIAYSTNITLMSNKISSNHRLGIYFQDVTNSNIVNNSVTDNTYGIHLYRSSDINITDNNLSLNNDAGISLSSTSSSYIIKNNFYNNKFNGVILRRSSSNKIIGNNISDNRDGIFIDTLSDANMISSNKVFNNLRGIKIREASNNDVISNTLINNSDYAIQLKSSSNTDIYHNNFINDLPQAYDDSNNGNQWDNGYPSGGNYWSDYTGVDNYKGPDQDIEGSDGIGDTNYSIDSDSVDNYPLMAPIGNYIFLYQGWNLISLPFIQSNTNLDVVLSSIKGSYDAVQWYNASDNSDYWKHNSIKKSPNLNDLYSIDHTMGFWIHITKPGGVLFEYQGTQPTSNQTISFHPGWNLVGYPSLTNYNRTEGLNNLTFGTHVDAILTYNASTQTWKKLGPSDYFEIGRGYWIHAKTKCEWEVPL